MSIGGLSSTTGTSTSTIRGYGGLASGLDRDTLIEQLTSGTQAKIDKANQEKTKLEWIQEAIRTITDKMYDFTQKYTSYTSSDNLLGSALYSRSQITVNGANSKYISVSGSTQASELMSVLGVKQLAQQASLSTVDEVSDRLLSLGSLSTDLNTKTDVNVAGGERIYIEYGNTSYTVKLGRGDGYSYGTAQEVADSINKSLEQVTIAGGKTLADVMNFTVSGDKLVANNTDAAGNTITMTGGTGEILDLPDVPTMDLRSTQAVILLRERKTGPSSRRGLQTSLADRRSVSPTMEQQSGSNCRQRVNLRIKLWMTCSQLFRKSLTARLETGVLRLS